MAVVALCCLLLTTATTSTTTFLPFLPFLHRNLSLPLHSPEIGTLFACAHACVHAVREHTERLPPSCVLRHQIKPFVTCVPNAWYAKRDSGMKKRSRYMLHTYSSGGILYMSYMQIAATLLRSCLLRTCAVHFKLSPSGGRTYFFVGPISPPSSRKRRGDEMRVDFIIRRFNANT